MCLKVDPRDRTLQCLYSKAFRSPRSYRSVSIGLVGNSKSISTAAAFNDWSYRSVSIGLVGNVEVGHGDGGRLSYRSVSIGLVGNWRSNHRSRRIARVYKPISIGLVGNLEYQK